MHFKDEVEEICEEDEIEEISTSRPPSPPKKPARVSVDDMEMPGFEKTLAQGIASSIKWGKSKLGLGTNPEPSGEVSVATSSFATVQTGTHGSATQNPSKANTEVEHHKVPGVDCPRKALLIPLLVTLENGEEIPFKAWVDNGCEKKFLKKVSYP